MKLAAGNAESDAWLADEMAARAIAEHPDEANARHYEVQADSHREYIEREAAKPAG